MWPSLISAAKLHSGKEAPPCGKTVREPIEKGYRKIVLNLSDVDYIDSSGIGELITAYTAVRKAKGELKLLNLTERVHDILQITRLYTVFDVESDEEVALRNFLET
jgi:anti-sigma B factor antagonist